MYAPQLLYRIVSRSTAPLCRRIDDYLRKAGTQPSSGQVKILSLLIDSSPSLLTSAAVVVGGRSCPVALERLSFTGAKLNELDQVTPGPKAGIWTKYSALPWNLLSKAELIRPQDP